jgi:hypothetical protein
VLLVENFPHGQQLDDSTRSLVKGDALLFGVLGVAEGDEEAALSPAFAFALHDGLEASVALRFVPFLAMTARIIQHPDAGNAGGLATGVAPG